MFDECVIAATSTGNGTIQRLRSITACLWHATRNASTPTGAATKHHNERHAAIERPVNFQEGVDEDWNCWATALTGANIALGMGLLSTFNQVHKLLEAPEDRQSRR